MSANCRTHPEECSKRGKTQHSMPDAARKNYLDFTPKNPPLPVTLERYGSLIFVYSLSPVRFPGCQGFLTRLCRFRSQNRHEPQTPVHPFPDRPDHLSHRKRCQNRSDSKSIQMSQEEDRHAGGHRQTDHIKRDLYVGIRGTRNVRQFPREQICRYDRQTTAVRQCNSDADQQIADCGSEA